MLMGAVCAVLRFQCLAEQRKDHLVGRAFFTLGQRFHALQQAAVIGLFRQQAVFRFQILPEIHTIII